MMFDGVSIMQHSKSEPYFTFNCFNGLYYHDVKRVAVANEYDFILLESDPKTQHREDSRIILENALIYQRLCFYKNNLDDSWLFSKKITNDLKAFISRQKQSKHLK